MIDQTEALVAIDVNSGSFRTDGWRGRVRVSAQSDRGQRDRASAALRDLGGVVVNDFIDMRKRPPPPDCRADAARTPFKRDRARTKILRTSPFGLIEMTRQRIRPSLKRSVYMECPSCAGSGLVKSAESMAIEVIRKLMQVAHDERVGKVTVTVEEEVANYLNNRKRRELARIEDEAEVEALILGREGASPGVSSDLVRGPLG